MRNTRTVFAVVGSVLLVAGCHPHTDVVRASSTTSTTTAPPAPLLAENGLRKLLLSVEQVNAAMQAEGMTVSRLRNALPDDSASMSPPECLAIDGAAQQKVYEGSGYTGVREQSLNEGDDFAHYVDQAVVLFPSVKQATAFFDAQSKKWPDCHEYRHVQSGSQWSTGEIVTDNDILSTIATQDNASGSKPWACGRALAARNNVVVDVNTCSADPRNSAADIAGQIAAKIPVRQSTE